jgi:hypothetical protein
MLVQLKTPLGGDLLLTTLDFGVDELLDPSTAHADQVVVVPTFIQLEDGLVAFEP